MNDLQALIPQALMQVAIPALLVVLFVVVALTLIIVSMSILPTRR